MFSAGVTDNSTATRKKLQTETFSTGLGASVRKALIKALTPRSTPLASYSHIGLRVKTDDYALAFPCSLGS